jgi:Fe-S-cluster-containing hydrogenase component 2
MTRKFLVSDPEKCTGCRICEIVCSAVKEKVFNPSFSRIRTVFTWPDQNVALACRLCEDPSCVRACPRNALRANRVTGVVEVESAKCDGCRWCMEACKFGAMLIHSRDKTVKICDLCEGAPKCVEFCPTEALELRTAEDFSQRTRRRAISTLITGADEKL